MKNTREPSAAVKAFCEAIASSDPVGLSETLGVAVQYQRERMRGLVVTWIVNMTDNTDILPAAEQAAPTIAENLLLQTALWDAFQLSIHQQRMKVGKAGKAELSEWMRNTATKLCARLSKASRKKLDELFQITASTPPETPPDSE